MSLTNEIVLRPRFKFEIKEDNETLLSIFENTKNTQNNFIVSRVNNHIFIKIPKAKQHFWSPQLHLEINNNESKNNCTLHGLFGPNPTVWTLFMFLHFVVIGLFIGFATWAYANWSLNTSYTFQLTVVFLMIVIWLALYFGGRIGKKTGTEQMYELHHFMRDTLRSKDIHAENNK